MALSRFPKDTMRREFGVDVDLFIKKMPLVVKKLISREALDNRRSVNQEAIALLEEALIHRVESSHRHRKHVQEILERYAELGRVRTDVVTDVVTDVNAPSGTVTGLPPV